MALKLEWRKDGLLVLHPFAGIDSPGGGEAYLTTIEMLIGLLSPFADFTSYWWWPAEPVRFIVCSIFFVPLIILSTLFVWRLRRFGREIAPFAGIAAVVWFAGLFTLLSSFFGPDRISHILLKLLGLYGLRILVGIVVVSLGFAAWHLKKTDLLVYGVAEVSFGAISAAVVAAGVTPGEVVLSRWTALIGSAYVVARGLSNISDGLKRHSEGKFGPVSFMLVSALSNFWSDGLSRNTVFLPFRSAEEEREFKTWRRLHAFDDPMDFIRERDRNKPVNEKRG